MGRGDLTTLLRQTPRHEHDPARQVNGRNRVDEPLPGDVHMQEDRQIK